MITNIFSITAGIFSGLLPSLFMFVFFQTKTKNKSKEKITRALYTSEAIKILLLIIMLSLFLKIDSINKIEFIWSFLVTHFILFISYWLLLLKKAEAIKLSEN